jgi:hypothetical protein
MHRKLCSQSKITKILFIPKFISILFYILSCLRRGVLVQVRMNVAMATGIKNVKLLDNLKSNSVGCLQIVSGDRIMEFFILSCILPSPIISREW